jgi:hypothetical protein
VWAVELAVVKECGYIWTGIPQSPIGWAMAGTKRWRWVKFGRWGRLC